LTFSSTHSFHYQSPDSSYHFQQPDSPATHSFQPTTTPSSSAPPASPLSPTPHPPLRRRRVSVCRCAGCAVHRGSGRVALYDGRATVHPAPYPSSVHRCVQLVVAPIRACVVFVRDASGEGFEGAACCSRCARQYVHTSGRAERQLPRWIVIRPIMRGDYGIRMGRVGYKLNFF
jgi:hypothetical protein